jgi:hypothetical protein
MPKYILPKLNRSDIKRSVSIILPLAALAAIGPLAMFYAQLPEYFFWALAFLLLIILVGITLGILIRPRMQITIDNNELTLTRPAKSPSIITRDSIT